MSCQSHKPLPFFPQPTATAAEASMRLPPLATQTLTSHIFLLLPFQRPPAPIADTSTSPPLLAVQAPPALQLFSLNVTNPARSCLRLQHRPSHVFPPVTSNPFFSFQLPLGPKADASGRLPLLVVQNTQAL